jgi:TatD DNase family protein
MNYFIDTHSHVYLPVFDDDRHEVLGRAIANGIGRVYMPAIDASTHEIMLQVEKDHEECVAMMGLHPCSANQDYEKELEIIKQHLDARPFIAIGEIGLDFYWDKTFIEQQYAAFRQQARWALEYDLPIVIHSRNAIDECIALVEEFPGIRGVFHCFSGTAEQAKRIIGLNMMLGIGGVITYKNAGLDKVLPEVGMDHIILETDAPYLSPVPFRGKRNEPSYIKNIAEKISEVMGADLEIVGKLTSQNALKLFDKA